MAVTAKRLMVGAAVDDPGDPGPGGTGDIMRLDDLGAWIWFNDARAIEADGTTYAIWSNGTGVIVGAHDHAAGQWTVFRLASASGLNDHISGGLYVRPDGRVLAIWSEHGGGLRKRITTSPGDISAWDAETTIQTGSCTYPEVVALSGESDRIYVFYRRNVGGSNLPQHYRTSDDGGATWNAEVRLVDNGGVPYVTVASDGVDQIHLSVSEDSPLNVATASLYHLHYDAGTWRNSAGTDIGSPSFGNADMTKVYDGDPNPSWTWDVALDGTTPVMLFATFPTTADHRYQYARLTGSGWVVKEIVAGGNHITDGTSLHYSAGLVFDHANPAVVYLCREVATDRWELERWTTADAGDNWTSEAITADSPTSPFSNFRPVVPRGDSVFDVLWGRGVYIDQRDLTAGIFAFPGVEQPDPAASSYDTEVSADSPAGYWRLAETSGADFADDTISANHAVGSQMSLGVSAPTGLGTAAHFNGTGSYMNVGEVFGDGITALTVTVWVRYTDPEDEARLFGLTVDSPRQRIELRAETDGKLTMLTQTSGDGSARTLTTEEAFDDNEWHRIDVIVEHGVERRIYVDAELQAYSTAASGVNDFAGTPLFFGCRNNEALNSGEIFPDDYAAADIANPAVYTVALSHARIIEQYSQVFDPPSTITDLTTITNLDEVWEVDDLALADNDPISAWEGKTAAKTWSQGTASLQPTYKAGVVGGLPAALFSADRLSTPGSLTQPNTYFLVGAMTIDGRVFFDGPSGGRNLLASTGGGNWYGFAGTVLSGSATDNDFHLFTLVLDGSSSALRIDGVTVAVGGAGSNNLGATWHLAATATGSAMLEGHIALVGSVDGRSPAKEIAKVENYLLDRYGLVA